jgi:hypothetical protein
MGLPRHHRESLSELLTSTATSLSDSSDEDGSRWASANFFGLKDPNALR